MQKITFKKFGYKYRGGYFYKIATIERGINNHGWIYAVENQGRRVAGGVADSLDEAKSFCSEAFFQKCRTEKV